MLTLHRRALIVALLALIQLLSSLAASHNQYPIRLQQDESIVKTQTGALRGIVAADHRAFLGVPFAAPPVGSLRWKPTQPAKAWSGTYNATQYSSGCPQRCKLPPHTCPDTQSEDCLYLNVWTPRLSHLSTPQPVMVFLPGGHFEQGGAGVSLYDGSYIVNSSGVILVTTNYRLGALGWVTINGDIPGNFGLMDQRMALQWVQENIAAFGGDPTKVTLFGQSAGGTSAVAHLISKASTGLFHRTIIQSNPITLPLRTFADAATLGKSFSQHLKCNNISCFSSASIADILEAQYTAEKEFNLWRPLVSFLPWVPTIDGKDITVGAIDAFAQGKYTKMPMIYGTVSEDAYMFIFLASNKSVNTVEYVAAVTDVFRQDAPFVLNWYPPPLWGDKRPTLGVLGTDYIFLGSNRFAVENIAASSPGSVWLYEFNHVLSFDAWGPNYPFCVGHVCHGAELPFVFNSVDKSGAFNFTAQEKVLAESMVAYWTNFARSGDPNQGTTQVALNWPAYDTQSRVNIEFETPANQLVKNIRGSFMDFWDSMGYKWGTF